MLLLVEVLVWSAAEVAEALNTSAASVNSGLQRARATMASRKISEAAPISGPQVELLNRYVDAFHRYDVDELVSLLCEDAALCMPPYTLWLRGSEAIRVWLLGRGSVCRDSHLVPVAACGSAAFGHDHHRDGVYKPWALVVLELVGDRIGAWSSFLDKEGLFPRFGLPSEFPKQL